MADITRREFMKVAGWAAAVTSFSAVTIPVIAYLYPADVSETPAEPVPVCKEDELPEGASQVVQFGRYPALVINTPEGLRAYSAVCTHFACIVKYNNETGEIDCPCHEGYFDPADGSVISGPPPTPLATLNASVAADGMIMVSVVDEEQS